MESYSFIELISGQALKGTRKIVIPKIQRDYAQGRKGRRATDVRHSFVSSLLATLRSDNDVEQKLDFIYGYFRDGNFEPLDGQQRLTTLFLLHWLVLPSDKRSLLVAGDGQPVVSYRTRPSAKDFCRFLVEIDYDLISRAYDDAVKKAADEGKQAPELDVFIRRLDEYRYSWELDPTVNSMLRMLNAMMAQLGTFQKIKELPVEKLNNIRFNIRDLDDLEQGDELYIKMNARGLELSDFDNTKSALEGDMLAAGIEGAVQAAWQSGIDGDWIDYFWHRAGADVVEPDKVLNLKDIRAIEDDLKTFILRLAALRWFERYYNSAQSADEEVVAEMSRSENTRRDALSPNFTRYLALRFADMHSATPGLCPVIDYAAIVADINSLLYREGSHCLAADSLAPTVKRNSSGNQSFIDNMLEGDFSRGARLILYGMLEFTHHFSAAQIATDEKLRADWATWLRVLRNLTLARNTNTPIDAPEEELAAMAGLKDFVSGFVKAKGADADATMSDYIGTSAAVSGLDPAIYREEQQKESLRKNAEWAEVLDRFENEGYLMGQLRAPLQWAKGDIAMFVKYASGLNKLINDGNRIWLPLALLLISDCNADIYPIRDSLLTTDFNRDRSFKRYLREMADGVYGPALKKLMDIWFGEYSDFENSYDFLKAVIARRRNDANIPLWKRQLAEFPEIIWERCRQLRIVSSENAYLIESKRYDKQWNINLCWLKKTRYSDDYFVLHNTKEEADVRDSIRGGKLVVADGEHGELLVAPTRRPRHRVLGKGLKLKKGRHQSS